MIAQIIVSIMFCIGLMLIVFNLKHMPSLKENWHIGKLGKPKKRIDYEKFIVMPLANRISKLVRLNGYDKKQLEIKLKNAGFSMTTGVDMTAEYYIARAIALMLVIFILAALFLFTRIYILTFLGVVLIVTGIIFYFKAKDEVNDRLKKKKAAISKELPQFMRTITQTLLYSRDILSMVDKYRLVAGSELCSELDILVLNMKTGNHEQALSAFSERIDIDYLTSFVTGLVSQSRGVEQSDFLKSVEKELKTYAIEALKTEAFKKTGKLQIAQYLLLAAMVLQWLTAIGLEAFKGFQTINNF